MFCGYKKQVFKSELRIVPGNAFVFSAFRFVYGCNYFIPVRTQLDYEFFVFAGNLSCFKKKKDYVGFFYHFKRAFYDKFVEYGFHCSFVALKLVSAGIYDMNRFSVYHRSSFYRVTRNARRRVNDGKTTLHKPVEKRRFSYVRSSCNDKKRQSFILFFCRTVYAFFRVFKEFLNFSGVFRF